MGRKPKPCNWRRFNDQSYEITFSYPIGTRRRERIYLQNGPSNDQAVATLAAQISEDLAQGRFDYGRYFPESTYVRRLRETNPGSAIYNVEHLLDAFLIDQATKRQSSALVNYRKICKYRLIPDFGSYYLAELNADHVEHWVAQQTCSNKRIKNILSVFRCALRYGVKKKAVDANILHGFEFERLEPPKRDSVEPFDAAEQKAILAALADQDRNLVQFWLWTGLRTSELVALHWSDIDFVKRRAKVWRKKTQPSKTLETTKTRKSRRTIDLLDPAMAALAAQKPFTFLKEQDGPIFHNPRTGKPWEGDERIREGMWKPALKRAGVRYRVPYQCRHTFASMMISTGQPLKWVAEQMGHEDFTMLARIYAHWLPPSDQDLGQAAIRQFFSAG